MREFQVRFVNEECTVRAMEGTSLLEARIAAGQQPDAPCGGQGSCGKCLVDVRPMGALEWCRVKACETFLEGDLEVRTLDNKARLRVLTEGGEAHQATWHPWVKRLTVQVLPCTVGESRADWDRLKDALAVKTGRRTWTMNLALASRLGELLKQDGGKLTVFWAGDQVLDACVGERAAYMAAFDVGTTTIAGYLLNIDAPETVVRDGMLNPQARYGADVIMRANYALEHGTEALAACVREALDVLLAKLCVEADIDREDVFAVSVVGNTCMHHLFLGLSPDSLVHAPYNPAISEGLVLRATDYGLHVHPNALLLMPPVIAGFVGADTVACLLTGEWDVREKCTLMIDIGTNGELVLGNRHRMIACSTAAGPAFEGAKIQCGMRGAEGAIDRAWLEGDVLKWHVIGDVPPVGICGSGLIDLVAALYRRGDIDESGKLLCCSEIRLGDSDVVLTQRDIREVQLAKGAICAGICLLAERLGIALADIAEVHIAGAFGNFMNPESACAIGLIPMELLDKIRSVGNAAGEGAKLVLSSEIAWNTARSLAQNAEFLELAALPQFQDAFIDALEFPEL